MYYLIGLFRDFHRFPRVNKALILPVGNLHRSLLAATVDACMTDILKIFFRLDESFQKSTFVIRDFILLDSVCRDTHGK